MFNIINKIKSSKEDKKKIEEYYSSIEIYLDKAEMEAYFLKNMYEAGFIKIEGKMVKEKFESMIYNVQTADNFVTGIKRIRHNKK